LLATGAAAALRGDEATPEAIRGGIEDLLNKPDYQLSAGRIRKEMLAMPAPAAVVPELEALATSFSGRSQHVHA
jgi:UDP:flavonoid glycosyltransferase YjiC (YdhE family)